VLGQLPHQPVNTYLITAAEPVLIDTGLAHDRGPLLDALAGAISRRTCAGSCSPTTTSTTPATCGTCSWPHHAPRWSPTALSLARLGEEWDVPAHRTLAVNPGTTLALGGRPLGFLRPPTYDSPATLAVFDHRSRSLFTSDSFGSVLAEPREDAADGTEADLLAG
jgi:flavorubredoxin